MNKLDFQPKQIHVFDDLEALKVIADPLRNQILEALIPFPQTVTQVAKKLGVDTSRMYYHVRLLEKHGFIQLVDTMVHGNLIEKTYWVTAYRFEVAPEAFNFNVETPEGTEKIISLLMSNIDATREDLRRSIYARHQQIAQGAPKNPRNVIDTRLVFHLQDEKAQEFHQRLKTLLDEFQQEEEALPESDPERIPWALSLVFYPSFYYQQEESDE